MRPPCLLTPGHSVRCRFGDPDFSFASKLLSYIRRVIDTDEKLAAFLPRLGAATWIALDTEADSLHAYPEKLCLIQISLEETDVLLDPLSGIQLGAVFQILSQHELILHGADYDLRLLRRDCGFVPTAIFDTAALRSNAPCSFFQPTSSQATAQLCASPSACR